MDLTRLALPDGRTLEVHAEGPPDADVLLYHHGTPQTGQDVRFLVDGVRRAGLRFVTYSRPGYAGSSRHPGRTVAEAAADSAAVLDALGVDAAYVMGVSGGGPHALATAALQPRRVRACAVVCGVGPSDAADLHFLAGMGEDNVEELGAALAGEEPLRAYLEPMLPALRVATGDDVLRTWASLLPPVDLEALTAEVGDDFVAGLHDALSGTADGWVDDDLAFARSWGVDLAAVSVPVTVWHGEQDRMAPVAHGRWVADHVRGAAARIAAEHGHISVVVGRLAEVLEDLRAAGR